MKKTGILFWDFLKIGAFTFGGGYAMIHLLERQFVARRKWLDREEFLDMVAVAESTPGPVAVNSATYIGYKVDGVIGALSATVAVCLPSFVIIYLISLFLDQFLALTYVGKELDECVNINCSQYCNDFVLCLCGRCFFYFIYYNMWSDRDCCIWNEMHA